MLKSVILIETAMFSLTNDGRLFYLCRFSIQNKVKNEFLNFFD